MIGSPLKRANDGEDGEKVTRKQTYAGRSAILSLVILISAGSSERSGARDELVRKLALVMGVVGVGVDRALGLVLVEEVEEAWGVSVGLWRQGTGMIAEEEEEGVSPIVIVAIENW